MICLVQKVPEMFHVPGARPTHLDSRGGIKGKYPIRKLSGCLQESKDSGTSGDTQTGSSHGSTTSRAGRAGSRGASGRGVGLGGGLGGSTRRLRAGAGGKGGAALARGGHATLLGSDHGGGQASGNRGGGLLGGSGSRLASDNGRLTGDHSVGVGLGQVLCGRVALLASELGGGSLC